MSGGPSSPLTACTTRPYMRCFDGPTDRCASGNRRIDSDGSTYLNGRLILPQPGIGLTELVHDELRPLPETARFGNEVYPVLLPFDANRILIGTRGDGFFLYDGSTVQSLSHRFRSAF